MRTVIKHTTSISEYKAVKAMLEQRATEAYNMHKAAYESWPHGDIRKVWIDADGNICVEYENGTWFHYNDSGEWW